MEDILSCIADSLAAVAGARCWGLVRAVAGELIRLDRARTVDIMRNTCEFDAACNPF